MYKSLYITQVSGSLHGESQPPCPVVETFPLSLLEVCE